MSRPMLKTWTICLIITISLSNPSIGVPLPESPEIPKTTLDAVLQKFPSLEKSKLDSKLVDVLNKTCADWQAINSTNSITKDGDINAQCLVLFESLVSFCSRFGDSLPKFLGLLPSLVPPGKLPGTLKNICSDDQSLYSLKDGDHNISKILRPEAKPANCYLLCSGIGKGGVPITHDTCKYSYFFATFNVTKMLKNMNSHTEEPLNLQAQNKNESPVAGANVPETALAENKSLQKPKQTGAEDQIAAQPQAIETDENDSAKKLGNLEAPADNIKANDVPENSEAVAEEPHASNEKLDSEPEKAIIADKPDARAENPSDAVVEPPNADAEAIKPPAEAEKPPTEAGKSAAVAEKPAAVAENPLEGEKENIPAPKAPNNKDENNISSEANQDELENEEAEEAQLAQEEANGKAEPVMPEETAEIKPPSIKGKPNTVEDEPVSSYNIPEDDMDGDSYFFSYFTVLMCLVIVGYVGYHNRQKILALLLEGKRGKRSGRQSRRPNSSNYHKLDSNLEEAISSSCTKNASNVIY